MREQDLSLMEKRGFPKPDFWFGRTSGYVHAAACKVATILREDIDIHFDDCDYGSQQTLEFFRTGLGEQDYRLMIVKDRAPMNAHFE